MRFCLFSGRKNRKPRWARKLNFTFTALKVNQPGGASLSFPFVKKSDRAKVINAALDLGGDGFFSEEEWVVKIQTQGSIRIIATALLLKRRGR